MSSVAAVAGVVPYTARRGKGFRGGRFDLAECGWDVLLTSDWKEQRANANARGLSESHLLGAIVRAEEMSWYTSDCVVFQAWWRVVGWCNGSVVIAVVAAKSRDGRLASLRRSARAPGSEMQQQHEHHFFHCAKLSPRQDLTSN